MSVSLEKTPDTYEDAEQRSMLLLWAFDHAEHVRTFQTKINFDKARIERDIMTLLGPTGWL